MLNGIFIFTFLFIFVSIFIFLKFFWFNERLGKFSNSDGAGIPGDGRCLFRSVVHGACLRSGKPSPTESLEKELADELRSKVRNRLNFYCFKS